MKSFHNAYLRKQNSISEIMAYRTHDCGSLRINNIDESVTLSGWVQVIRKLGSITFVDLRDRYGITQLYFNETLSKTLGTTLGREFVLQVEGKVIERSNKNPQIPTGDIEIDVKSFKILNKSKTPPFTIEEETDGGEELRMKYRYLDLRRSPLQKNIMLRNQINFEVRSYLNKVGFLDIETPFLIKSTPEGARDFVVPSRMNSGEFYALPQSPQTFKQLLMVSGFDKYYQIVKCFRDEDLRADRQPEFTQIDCEMSFVEQDDILNTFEGMLTHLFKEVKNVTLPSPFPRMTFEEAMRNYGNDKPDIRFDMAFVNLKAPKGDLNKDYEGVDLTSGVDFKVLDDAPFVAGIVVPGAAAWSRRQIDDWTKWIKMPQRGMGGMIYVKYQEDETVRSSIDKFYSPEQLKTWLDLGDAKPGDMMLVLSGEVGAVRKALSALRMEIANHLALRNPEEFAPLWVMDFPLLEYTEEDVDGGGAGRWMAMHHPFTSPKKEHIAWLDDQEKYPYIAANAYDIILNGHEIGGGSIRIHDRDVQMKMFEALGFTAEQAQDQFGFLLKAFEYGAPPHGGIALGFDRLCALMGGEEVIRDFIAFPKNNAGRDVMLQAPAALDQNQLQELSLNVIKKKED